MTKNLMDQCKHREWNLGGGLMTYKIAICDDCTADTEYLSALAGGWAADAGHIAAIREFPSAEAFLFQYEEENDFDILLLDIEMGGINGVELARRIRERSRRVQIVFITGYPDFMAEGYEVSALHYLMKPVSEKKLYSVLDRAADNLKKAEKQLKVTFDRQTVFVPFNRILYIEAQRQFVRIHTEEGDYRMKTSLAEMETELDEYFYRCQRSFLVNLSFVTRIKSQCVILKNGEEIPISRGLAEKIGKAVIKLF